MILWLMILQAYEILRFIKKVKWALKNGFIIVLDYDGTMVRFYYGKNALLPCLDSQVYEYSKTHVFYANVYTFKIMQFIISKLPKERVFVLTRSEVTLRQSKTDAIVRDFGLDTKHIFHVQESSEKVEVLRRLLGESDDLNLRKYIWDNSIPEDAVIIFTDAEKIIFIEDSHSAALAAEENLRGKVYAYLASSLFV